MNSKNLDNLVQSGLLKKEPPDPSEFDGLLESGKKRLSDARKDDLAPESRFDLAYNAAHSFAPAALRWHGYRPDKQRFVVFQVLPFTLGLGPEVWRVLDKCHRLRNLAEYEGSFGVDEQLLSDLLAATEIVSRAVDKLGPIKN